MGLAGTDHVWLEGKKGGTEFDGLHLDVVSMVTCMNLLVTLTA